MIPPHRQNLLLRALDPGDRASIWPHLERVRLTEGEVIVAQGERITSVCFPECGITSLTEVLADGCRVDVALVGREGMTNSQVLLGCDHACHEASVRVGDGTALRMGVDDLRALCARSPAAHALFLRFIHTVSTQSTRGLASNAVHPVLNRVARWLLMCHDRIDDDDINLSHESISKVLAVRRATVTEAIQCLEGEGALRNTRGRIVMRDRARMEELAGDAYGLTEAQYCQLIAPFGKGAEREVVHQRTAGTR